MAFSGINAQQELNQRKILEDIQIKKQLLQKGSASTASSVVIPPYMQMSGSEPSPSASVVSVVNQSFGYFITQDSAFGNSILPVLPRYDTK